MAAPLTTQVAVPQQASLQQDPALQQQKQGGSKFDAVLANRDPALANPAVKVDPALLQQLQKLNATPSQAPALSTPDADIARKLSVSMTTVDHHWNSVNTMLKTLFTHKDLSMQDCLKMQAVMQKYSMELDLTSKIVEKATNGLKDTLKTQV